MAEVPPLKVVSGSTKQWDGTADSLRSLSLGIGVAAPVSGLEIASGDLLLGTSTQLVLVEKSGDPGATANQGKLYTKDVAAITQLHFQASDGTVTQLTPASGGGTPGGANTQVQYNNAGAFAGDADFTFDGTSVTLNNSLIMAESANPGGTADQGKLYTKDVSAVTELFYQASDGTVTQLTPAAVAGNTTTETSVTGVVGRKESANITDTTVGALSLRLGNIARGFPNSSRTIRLAALLSTTDAGVGAEVDFYNTLTSQVIGTLSSVQITGPEYVELDVTAKVGVELTDDAVNDIECRIRQTNLDATERAYCDWAAVEITTTAGGSFLPVPVTGVSGYQDTASATEVEVGAFVLDPTEYPGRTFTFDVLIQTTIVSKAVTIDLYNLTDGMQVASSVLTSTSITPDRQTVVLASPADLPAAEKVYVVRIKLASAGGADRAIVKWAALKIS